ncbi:MAG: efflux RND transporter periplasmic adaptor subunit, partial [Acidobacteriaceae bacterium]|nr:efflux RND transporter periplasmic adaptor subunit [Acidobacteriaceae bacterium]
GVVLARNVSAGQHFEHDMVLYQIADLTKIWVVAEVDQADQPYLRPGYVAEVRIRDSGSKLPARVTESLPESDAAAGTLKLRLEADNPRLSLRPNMLVDVAFAVRRPPAVTVPVDALVDSGTRSRVYVARENGIFEPREVETGWRHGDRVQITSGIRPGEQVVTNATFLIDSESRLRSIPAPAEP